MSMKGKVTTYDMQAIRKGSGDIFFMDGDKSIGDGGHTRVCVFRHWPDVGDFLTTKMQSGKVARFLILDVNTPSDPGDQTFLRVRFDSYVSQ